MIWPMNATNQPTWDNCERGRNQGTDHVRLQG